MSVPTTQPAIKIATLFNRRLTTPWSEKEVKAYKAIYKAYPAEIYLVRDIELVCDYTLSERKKGDKGIHRRDLPTLLNNFFGELDRAREWSARAKRNSGYTEKRKNLTGLTSEEDWQRIGTLAKQELDNFKLRMQPK